MSLAKLHSHILTYGGWVNNSFQGCTGFDLDFLGFLLEKNTGFLEVIYLSPLLMFQQSYRVIQNFASPSRAENKQASAKLTISSSNIFNSKWENQILDSATAANSIFPKRGFVWK